jgi:hypothetical protein
MYSHGVSLSENQNPLRSAQIEGMSGAPGLFYICERNVTQEKWGPRPLKKSVAYNLSLFFAWHPFIVLL